MKKNFCFKYGNSYFFQKYRIYSSISRMRVYCISRTCVPSNFMANRQVPKFSLNNCAQSPKKTFMCPKFRTNPVLMYTKCHISTNLSSFLKLCLLYCQKYLPLLQQIADSLKKIGLVGTLSRTHIFDMKNRTKF